MRSIAESFLHDTIRKTESLPVVTQVTFSQNLDVLLVEDIRKLNKNKRAQKDITPIEKDLFQS